MALATRKTKTNSVSAELVRCLDSYICRPAGWTHDAVARQGEVMRADSPVVACNPTAWISDDCTDEEFNQAHISIYDRELERVPPNNRTQTHLPGRIATLMEAIEDFPAEGGVIKSGSLFPQGHRLVTDNPQRFRVAE